MTNNEKTSGQGSTIDWVERARTLVSLIAEASDRTEAEGQVPADIMKAMHDAELFRAALPRSMGGGEASSLVLMVMCEAIGSADASTAWCLGQALGCTWAAAYTPTEVAQEIFGPTDAVVAWGPPGPQSKAIKVDGGYRVTGEWRFGSGSRNATWIGGHSMVYEDENTRAMDANGRPILRTMLMPTDSVRRIDVWQVMGLRGTGSDNYSVEDLFVPEGYTTWRDSQPDRTEFGPLYSISLLTIYGIVFSGLALGVARSALNDFIELAKVKGSHGGPMLRENAVIQAGVATANARILSSRAFLKEMISEQWEVLSAGETPTLDLRARLRLAMTYSMNQSREAVNFAFQAAGTNAIFETNPFERRMRDIHTLSAQGQSHTSNYEPVGEVFLGLDPSSHRV
jgi:alkylation response protein AidB-like acyl-CoA dehydrogenase